MEMKENLKEIIKADLYRNCGKVSVKQFLIHLFYSRSFKITFWLRLTANASEKRRNVLKKLFLMKYKRVCKHYCVDIPYMTSIGSGFLIYHGFGIVIHRDAVIGKNVSISHQVTIGSEKGFSPTISDKVIISPGAKIFGKVEIGENSVIGANAVVVKDVPANSVSVGIPNHSFEKKHTDTSIRFYWEPK
jgi:serine O-acetyltransferase